MKKFQSIILYLIVLIIPFNVGYIFNFSTIQNINGFREHLTLSLYLFDLLFIPLLTIFIWDNHKNIFTKKLLGKLFKQPLFYLSLLIILSPFTRSTYLNPFTWYKTIRLLELLIFFIIIRNILKQYTVLTYFKFLVFTSGLIQSVIAIIQFTTQKSIGLKFLGESIIAPNILGVAKFSFEGEKLIRAYGTFPHPNILGIFLLFSLSAGFSLIITKKNLLSSLRWHYRLAFLVEFILIYLGILLTYSRSIIVLSVITSVIFIHSQRKFITKTYKNLCLKLHIPFFLQTSLAIIVIFSTLFYSYNLLTPRLCLQCPGDNSLSLRRTYQQTANLIIFKYPLTGVGLGNFIPISKTVSTKKLSPWNLQPVHNIYLLIASELGLVGLFLFLLTIFFYAAHNLRPKYLAKHPLDLFFILVLLAGFSDHYFWTIHQGQLIFWSSLALVSISKTTKVDSPKYHFKSILKNARQLLNLLQSPRLDTDKKD